MKRRWAPLTLLAASLVVMTAPPPEEVSASPSLTRGGAAASPTRGGVAGGDEKPLPKPVEKSRRERLAAADLVARGLAKPDANGVVTLKNGKRVRYRLQGTESLTVALVDFTDVRHGSLPEPDRATDNSTYWPADTSKAHFEDVLASNPLAVSPGPARSATGSCSAAPRLTTAPTAALVAAAWTT